MRKTIVLFSIFISTLALKAQIIVNEWDVAGVGKMLIQATDTLKTMTPGSINPGPAGANRTWNFSTLGSHILDTLIFTNPNWFPSGSQFPNSNLMIFRPADSSQLYLENISTGVYIVGAYGDPVGLGTLLAKFNPKECMAGFPMTYGSAYKDTSVVDMMFPYTAFPGFDSVRVKETKYKDVKTDGWGTTITPLGSFPSLRTRGQVITIDSLWLHNVSPPGWFPAPAPYSPTIDTSWHFAWWARQAGFALLEFDSTKADTIRNITWLKIQQVIGAVDEAKNIFRINLYPNPAADLINFEVKGLDISSLRIFDPSGRLVVSIAVPQSAGVVSYSTRSFSSGTYFFVGVNAQGKAAGSGRFEVER